MKLKYIENRELMNLKELESLFMEWFSNGFTKEEGCVLYNIFVNKYFLHLPTDKVIDVGGTSFGTYLAQIGKDEGHWLWFHENCQKMIIGVDKKIIKKVHEIVDSEIKLIADENEIQFIENVKWEMYSNISHPGKAEWIEEHKRLMMFCDYLRNCLGNCK